MDTFMDKLAQKLNAQEMIRANAAAEAAEIHELRSRVAEYSECLDRLQSLEKELVKSQEKLAALPEECISPKMDELVQECLQKLDAFARDGSVLEELQASVKSLESSVFGIKLDPAELQSALNAKFENTEETIHKECVKVYRNVQAVIAEENTKQSETMAETAKSILKGTSKMTAVLILSIAALVASFGGIVVQLLVYFQII